jgi:hypothetical protein
LVGQRAGTAGVQGVDQHHAGLLLAAHARQQVGLRAVRRQAPVFIRVEPAVAVGIAKAQAIHLQDRLAAHADDGLVGWVGRARRGAAAERRRCGDGDGPGDGARVRTN